MEKEVKCAICGNNTFVDSEVHTNLFIEPNTQGAKAYYDLWHFPINRCESCNYSSMDISVCENKNIMYVKECKEILNNKLLDKLYDARPNLIKDYILAGIYYQMINDSLISAKCFLQAGDYIYDEAMYWRVYILDEDDNKDPDYIEIITFADGIYKKGISILHNYLADNVDIDAELLLAGILRSFGKKEMLESDILLNKLSKSHLNQNQKLIYEFLLNE